MSGPRRARLPSAAASTPGLRPATGRQHGRRLTLAASVQRALPRYWPLAALLILAAAVRLPTLSLQSFWYDEAFTPVHVLHPSLIATLHAVAALENTPPLWYVLEWAFSRVLGTGVVALRLLSALAGIALVAVGWAIGSQVGSRRSATILAAILALNPLFVWYSQEARSYELYALTSSVSLLCFLRAYRRPGARTLALWVISSVLALLSHYFAVFLLGPEALLLLAGRPRPAGAHAHAAAQRPTGARAPASRSWAALRPTLVAAGALVACCAALAPLVIAQAGRGTQWIGQWALSDRLAQTPGYYLLGANGSVLGHGLLALSALPLAATIVLGARLLRGGLMERAELEALRLLLGLGIVAIVIPLALALAGEDYFAPRNLIADWIPLSAALALVLGARAAGRPGTVLAVVACLAAAAVLVVTDLDARLQRADWSAVAAALGSGSPDRAIVTVELGAAPLEYYLPRLGLRYLSRRRSVTLREVDLVGYAPLRPAAIRPPTGAFSLIGHSDHHGLLAYRYAARAPQRLSGRFLRSLTITIGATASSEVLTPAAVAAARS